MDLSGYVRAKGRSLGIYRDFGLGSFCLAFSKAQAIDVIGSRDEA